MRIVCSVFMVATCVLSFDVIHNLRSEGGPSIDFRWLRRSNPNGIWNISKSDSVVKAWVVHRRKPYKWFQRLRVVVAVRGDDHVRGEVGCEAVVEAVRPVQHRPRDLGSILPVFLFVFIKSVWNFVLGQSMDEKLEIPTKLL